MSNYVTHEFPYRLSFLLTGFFMLLVATSVGMCLYVVIDPPQDMTRVRGIDLSPTQVRVLMGVIVLLAPISLVALGRSLVLSLVHPSRIGLTDDSILIPKPDRSGLAAAGKEEMELRYEDIISVEVLPLVNNIVQLRINYRGGCIGLPRYMFQSRRDFDLLFHLLSQVAG